MKKLTSFAVNYPVTVLMAIMGILLLGVISYQKLGIDLFPDLTSPRIFVEIKSGAVSYTHLTLPTKRIV